ncbi:MAG TPA: sigma 54-interacting transcriptional regulator [Thermoanaerobaculaceae bacterium]|nr:sigma 54-interacting transcriptional regulator [Thermoanaerobaculaceae bacterium]
MKTLLPSRHPQVRELGRRLTRAATSDIPLLLEGETGVGKSWTAARVHRSSRPGRPFVVVDCGALAPGLVASELFGHRAGAFTDASRPRAGWLERAGDGTLVLDRLESLPPEAQVALLRVLEEARFFPVGATQPRPFRARVIALTDVAAGDRVTRGELRADLYHRVAGLPLTLPPLRQRHLDILPHAERVLRRLATRSGAAHTLDPEARAVLEAYPWPGNFRELEATLARAALTTRAEIGVVDLGLPAGGWETVAAQATTRLLPLAEVERLYALWVLASQGGNVTRTARVLGVSRRTVIRWRKERPRPT